MPHLTCGVLLSIETVVRYVVKCNNTKCVWFCWFLDEFVKSSTRHRARVYYKFRPAVTWSHTDRTEYVRKSRFVLCVSLCRVLGNVCWSAAYPCSCFLSGSLWVNETQFVNAGNFSLACRIIPLPRWFLLPSLFLASCRLLTVILAFGHTVHCQSITASHLALFALNRRTEYFWRRSLEHIARGAKYMFDDMTIIIVIMMNGHVQRPPASGSRKTLSTATKQFGLCGD